MLGFFINTPKIMERSIKMPKRKDGWLLKEDREKLRCKECCEELPITSFFKRGFNKQGHQQYDSRCKQCSKEHTKKYRKRHNPRDLGLRKIKCDYVEEIKTECAECGYNRCAAALDFHHINKETKVGGIAEFESNGKITLEMLKEEIRKCVVLCANCHRELHAGFKENG